MSEIFILLLNRSLIVSGTILVLAVFRLAFRKMPKRLLGTIWTWVWICLLLPHLSENPLNLLPSGEIIEPEILYDPLPTIDTGIRMVNEAVNPIISESLAPAVGASANPLQIVMYVTSLVWFVGMIGMILYGVASYMMLRSHVADAVLWKDCIFESEKVKTPFVLGVFKPCIYLPFHLAENDRELVVLHEKKHVDAAHPFMKIFGYFVLCIYWFQPVIWWGYHLFCKDMELECDELVLKEIGEERKKDYAKALLNCSTMHQTLGTCPVAFGEVGAKFRIQNILQYKKHAKWMGILTGVLLVFFFAFFIGKPIERKVVPENIPYITDAKADWDNVTRVTFYADGYFGRTLEEPLVLTDAEMIEELVTMILDKEDYAEVKRSEAYEGLCEVFVDFGNGAVVSMYRYVNYGTVSSKMQASGGIPYHLPEKFCERVCELMEAHYPESDIDTSDTLVLSDDIYRFVIWDGTTGTRTAYVRNTIEMFEAILHRYENLEFIPFENAEDSIPQFSGYTYCLEVYDRENDLIQTIIPREEQIYIDGVMYDCSISETLKELNDYVRRWCLWGDPAKELQSVDGVVLYFEKYANTHGQLEIYNNSHKNIQYGDDFSIQMYDAQSMVWIDVKAVGDVGFNDIAHEVPKGETMIQNIDWTLMYGELAPGTYRILKPVIDFRGTGDFTEYVLWKEFEIYETTE